MACWGNGAKAPHPCGDWDELCGNDGDDGDGNDGAGNDGDVWADHACQPGA